MRHPLNPSGGGGPEPGDLGTYSTLALALAAGAASGYQTARTENGAALAYDGGLLADLRVPLVSAADVAACLVKREGGAGAGIAIDGSGLTITPDGLTVYALDAPLPGGCWYIRALAALTTPGTPATDDFIGIGIRKKSNGAVMAWGVSFKSTGYWAHGQAIGAPPSVTVTHGATDTASASLPAALDLGSVRLQGGNHPLGGAYMGGALTSSDSTFPSFWRAGTNGNYANIAFGDDCEPVFVIDISQNTPQTFRNLRISSDPILEDS